MERERRYDGVRHKELVFLSPRDYFVDTFCMNKGHTFLRFGENERIGQNLKKILLFTYGPVCKLRTFNGCGSVLYFMTIFGTR